MNLWGRGLLFTPLPSDWLRWEPLQLPPIFFFLKIYLFIFRERESEGEREERNIDVQGICQLVASRTPPPGDLTCSPGSCPRLGIEPVTFQFAG